VLKCMQTGHVLSGIHNWFIKNLVLCGYTAWFTNKLVSADIWAQN
jgi:hypothetical protein